MNAGDAVNANMQRGLVLAQQGRHADAERYFRDALREDPENDAALFHLALSVASDEKRLPEALRIADRAIELQPENSGHHALKASLLADAGHGAKALDSARQAVALNPHSPFAFTAKTRAHLVECQWADGEASAREALRLDPDHRAAGNLLAHALRVQGKAVENAGHLRALLARDAEDAWTHANAGWAALQDGRRREAEEHFREALRLNPELEPAREGLLNSFRARSPLYRTYLTYCFWMQRLNKKARWTVILALYIGARSARMMGGTAWAPVGAGIGIVYLLLVFWVHVARGFGNFMLLFDAFARHALRRGEVLEAWAVGLGITLGLTLLAAGLSLGPAPLVFMGIGLVISAIPFSHTFTNAAPKGRWIFGLIGSWAVLGAVSLGVCQILTQGPVKGPLPVFGGLGCLFALLSTWMANFSSLRR